MKYAIVGSGVAGLAACEAIRSLDKTGEIYMLGMTRMAITPVPGWLIT